MPWDAYLTTIVTLHLSDRVVTIAPTDGPPAGELPTALGLPVHVITAWNPGSRRLDRRSNDQRNTRLRADLETTGARWVPARGCSPDGTWCEDGMAVGGWRRERICALARQHGQAAVFELWPGRLLVVASDLARVEGRASAVTSVPAR